MSKYWNGFQVCCNDQFKTRRIVIFWYFVRRHYQNCLLGSFILTSTKVFYLVFDTLLHCIYLHRSVILTNKAARCLTKINSSTVVILNYCRLRLDYFESEHLLNDQINPDFLLLPLSFNCYLFIILPFLFFHILSYYSFDLLNTRLHVTLKIVEMLTKCFEFFGNDGKYKSMT